MADELNDDGTPKTPVKVEFSPEQQEAVNKILDARFAKIQEKHEKEKREIEARLKREAEEARQQQHEPNPELNPDGTPKVKPEDETKEQFKRLLDTEKNRANLAEAARKRAEEERNEAKAESLNVKKTQAMYNAMSKQSFYQPEDVFNLTQNKVIYDVDSNTFVVKENGVIKQNSSLQNMTLEEYFSEVAATRPYLVNGETKGGAGSRESASGSASSAGLIKTKADLKTPREKAEWISKFGYDKFEQLPMK